MWNTQIELDIIKYGKEKNIEKLDKIRKNLYEQHRFVTYALSRFLEEYGDSLGSDKNVDNMFRHLSESYSILERGFRILKYYDKIDS